ncbi:OLC1v1012748C1 [Oldenlandia corymbosa var. corymbosa]|uniref:OLC1v1012748C1 n=1 Tax=Oldenlandia corymbosa var. corymbosa TaxID=529605 RepID=A0AAV1DWK2_OLDCO|nr:OLC1v1012748C1 [Oldenlandia corymbosa var. corymbosa]
MSTRTAATSTPIGVTSSGVSTVETTILAGEQGASSTLPLAASGVVSTPSLNRSLYSEFRSSYHHQFYPYSGVDQSPEYGTSLLNAKLGLDQWGRIKESTYNTPQSVQQIIIEQQNNTITRMVSHIAALEQSLQKINPKGAATLETPLVTPDTSMRIPIPDLSMLITHENPLFSNASMPVQGLATMGVSGVIQTGVLHLGGVPEGTPVPNPSWYYKVEQGRPAFMPPLGNFTFNGWQLPQFGNYHGSLAGFGSTPSTLAMRWPPRGPGYPVVSGFTPPRGIVPPPRPSAPPFPYNGQNLQGQGFENAQTHGISTPLDACPVHTISHVPPTTNSIPNTDKRLILQGNPQENVTGNVPTPQRTPRQGAGVVFPEQLTGNQERIPKILPRHVPTVEEMLSRMSEDDQRPEDYISHFELECSEVGHNSRLKLRLFPYSLASIALDWYRTLEPGFIPNWGTQKWVFIHNFQWTMPRLSIVELSQVKQKAGEMAETYLTRFRQMHAKIPGATFGKYEESTIVKMAISEIQDFKVQLAVIPHPIRSLTQLTEMVHNTEKVLKAKSESRPTKPKSWFSKESITKVNNAYCSPSNGDDQS